MTGRYEDEEYLEQDEEERVVNRRATPTSSARLPRLARVAVTVRPKATFSGPSAVSSC